MKGNQVGFGLIPTLLIAVIVGIIGFTGWFVYHSQKVVNKSYSSQSSAPQTTISKSSRTPSTETQNAGYLVVKEWDLTFKIPSGLSDVQYQVTKNPAPNGDGRLAIYAKPTGSTMQYRSDYMALNPNGYPLYPIGVLYRSQHPTQYKMSVAIDGKKLGNYYYYTEWAFSGLATGASCTNLYGAGNDASESECAAEQTVFALVNQGDTALLNTIQISQ